LGSVDLLAQRQQSLEGLGGGLAFFEVTLGPAKRIEQSFHGGGRHVFAPIGKGERLPKSLYGKRIVALLGLGIAAVEQLFQRLVMDLRRGQGRAGAGHLMVGT
jgi:hypothetical protein